ncbi:MAG: hypothetical protein ACKO6Q_06460 [Bacteroidota bacterium]
MLVKSNINKSAVPFWEVTKEGVLLPVCAKKKAADEEEEEEAQEDDWEKTEEEEAWDPDFDEFDVPKSRSGKSDSKEEEDVNFEEDEELNDLFDDEGFEEDASDEDF